MSPNHPYEYGLTSDIHSAKSSAKWNVTIPVISSVFGLNVQVGARAIPVFGKTQTQGAYSSTRHKDPQLPLSKALKDGFDVNDTISSLKETFKGVWEHCFPGMHAYALANPVFTVRADLLL